MNKLLLPVATIFIAGCLTPQLYTTNGQFGEKKSITKIINDSGLETNIGIKAVSLKTGKTLFELNSNSLFNPASNNKCKGVSDFVLTTLCMGSGILHKPL